MQESKVAPPQHSTRPVTRLVQVLAGGNHVLHRHARGHQALVRIAEYEFGDVNLLWHKNSDFRLPAHLLFQLKREGGQRMV